MKTLRVPSCSLQEESLRSYMKKHLFNSIPPVISDPNKVKILRMTVGRCVIRRCCAGDGSLKWFEDPYSTLCMSMDYTWTTVEDIPVDFALRPCALPYTQDYRVSRSM